MAYRKQKLEELIKRKIGDFIMKEIKDPRVGFVSITNVDLNKDSSIAEVGVSVLGEPREIRKSLEGLKSATGFIQRYLSKELNIRSVPKIIFKADASLARAARMSGLIDDLLEGSASKNIDAFSEDSDTDD